MEYIESVSVTLLDTQMSEPSLRPSSLLQPSRATKFQQCALIDRIRVFITFGVHWLIAS